MTRNNVVRGFSLAQEALMEFKPHKPDGWYTPPQEAIMSNKRIMVGAIHELPKELPRMNEDLPWQAFAIVGDKDDPSFQEGWKLPHHTKAIFRAIKGKIGIEHTVDWERMPAAVAALSRGGHRGQRVEASEGEIISAARHLANHYTKADKPVPDTLAVLT